MTAKICSCEGLNPKCEKCHGSGYVNIKESKAKVTSKASPKVKLEKESLLSNDASNLHRKEIQNIADKIIATLSFPIKSSPITKA